MTAENNSVGLENAVPRLLVDELHKSFGDVRVLAGVSLSVQPGESLAVLGRSGTGKSVLFKTIVGLLTPDAGTVKIDGQDLTIARGKDRDALLAKVAVVFQGSALFDSLNVWRNVMFAPMMQGQTKGENRAALMDRAATYLRQVGMTSDDLMKPISALSGGMQKRVAIARAIAQSPELVFFDEPTTGLDPITAGTIDDLIADVVETTGVSAVTITHDLSTARIVADKALFLEGGKVQWMGAASALDRRQIADSLPPMLQQFLTDRAINRGKA